MSRMLRLLTACVVCSVAACGAEDPASSDPPSNGAVRIVGFTAESDALETASQSTMLHFAVDPPDAKIAIEGLGDLTGRTSARVTPGVTTTYHLTATRGGVTVDDSVIITVGPSMATAFQILPDTAVPTAGDPLAVTIRVLGSEAEIAESFRGTVHVASTDPHAVLPPDLTFTARDGGTKHVSVTLETAGPITLTATDSSVRAGVTGVAFLIVRPTAAASFEPVALPEAATAGDPLVLTIIARDAFGNVATGFGGQVRVASNDPTDILPPSGSFTAGVRTAVVQFTRSGNHTARVEDVAARIPPATTSSVAIGPGAPTLVLAVPPGTNAGYPVPVGVAVRDRFDNAVPTYTGTVSFTSTDVGPGAAAPAPIAFTGSEGGVATTIATFVTIGPQTLFASDGGSPQAAGSATAAVHGLVYTAPSSGRVRLIASPAATSAQVIQLDLVASERLEVSTFFGGPGSFSAGMNLPLDTTRVGAGSPLFTRGAALPAGTGVPASIGLIGPDHVLYAAVSRKRVAGPIATQDTDVAAGQVFYSVRLVLTQSGAVGTVFDGAQPMAMFRAAVRDQFGDDFVGQSEIGVGKLEIR
jgi:hypothetical protein